MSNRIFDSSQLTVRKKQKTIANSFLSRINSPNPQQGFGPLQGIYDSSILNDVKTGNMTEYTRYPTCVAISVGCPCPETNSSIIPTPILPAVPGPVTGITFTVGSIIVSWNPPTTGEGPFQYIVTPYLNNIKQTPVITTETEYRFTELQEWKPYTFTVCAMNNSGQGPIVPSPSYFIAPPESLSIIMSESSQIVVPEPSMIYILNTSLNFVLNYVASVNLGPTRGSRFIYVWITSVVSAWNWVRAESRISNEHDNWNWTTSKSSTPLNNKDSIIWLCTVIDYITPIIVPSEYKSIYNCPSNLIENVKILGEWDRWVNDWQNWYNYRQNDGFVNASTAQPTSSDNWNETIVIDGTTVTNILDFPQPQKWTRLTVQNKKQNYLTYSWDNVLSSCLTESDESAIQNSVEPLSGLERDQEIDIVKEYSANLTEQQKVIAEFWAGGPGTTSPPLMFIWLWKEYIRIMPGLTCPHIMFSLLDLAIHLFEGGRITWRLKAAHMESRPIQEIRRRYAGQTIKSWNGDVDGSQWIPYQEANFVTPPFADFPSGHSHFSKAFALTMNKWFGNNIFEFPTFYDQMSLICPLFDKTANGKYGNFIIQPARSLIQSNVPSINTVLRFTSWNAMADSAGISRLYGGIHATSAHTSSQNTAIQVDQIINNTWNVQTQNI
jgi:hypothetical protein